MEALIHGFYQGQPRYGMAASITSVSLVSKPTQGGDQTHTVVTYLTCASPTRNRPCSGRSRTVHLVVALHTTTSEPSARMRRPVRGSHCSRVASIRSVTG